MGISTPSVPYSIANGGAPGNGSTTFFNEANDMLDLGLRPAYIVLPSFTVNDEGNSLSTATVDAYYVKVDALIAKVAGYSPKPKFIGWTGLPRSAYNAASETARQYAHTQMRNRVTGGSVDKCVEISAAIQDGASPPRIQAIYDAGDGAHPNGTARPVMAALLAAAFGPGAPFLDGLSPTGAWSPSRKMKTAYGGALYSLTSGDVQTLYDQSGNARDFGAPGGGGTLPSLDTSTAVAALRYDGAADWLKGGALSNFITATDAYMICSFKATGFATDTATSYLNAALFQDDGNIGTTTRANAGSPLLYSTNWGGGQSVQHSIVANTAYVVETRHQGGVLYQRLNGANEQSIASGNTALSADFLNLGGRSLSTAHMGLIYEAVIFSTIPTLAERNALVQAMGSYVGASL
jgi:hypothetical protein